MHTMNRELMPDR